MAEPQKNWPRLLEEIRARLNEDRRRTVMHGGDPYEDDIESDLAAPAAAGGN